MTLLEHYQERYEEGLKEGQKNIERERKRADAAETERDRYKVEAVDAGNRVRELEAQIEALKAERSISN